MPADSLTLYHPLSLQSLPEYASLSSTRHLVGMTRSMSSSHASVGALAHSHHHTHGHHPYALDGGYGRLSSYGGSSSAGALHPSSHTAGAGGYLGVPMSAPASLNQPNPFMGDGSNVYGGASAGSGAYGSRVVSPDGHGQSSGGAQRGYTFPEHGHSASPGPGSGYTTPH
jgi:homeobox protein Meis1